MEPQDRDDETKDDDDETAADAADDDQTTGRQEQQGAQASKTGSELKSVASASSPEEMSREKKDPNPYQNPEKARDHCATTI